MNRVAPASTVTRSAPDVCLGRKLPASWAVLCQLAYALRFAGVFGTTMNTWMSENVIRSRIFVDATFPITAQQLGLSALDCIYTTATSEMIDSWRQQLAAQISA